MPLYAYKCDACDHDFKVFHGMDDKQENCTKCSSISIKKQFPASNNIKVETNNSGPKQRIEKYIEETREAIEQQVAEARKDYNP